MARKNNANIERANRNIKDIAKGISGGMQDLYRSTYMSTSQQSDDLKDLNNRINSSIDNIVNRNMETIGIPSVSKLYSRMSSNKDNKVVSELEKMFDDGIVSDDLYSLFMSNRYLKELDNEIDTVCKYMPRLEEALQAQKDCVLCADHFSKDFISFTHPNSGVNESIFNERAKDIKKKYALAKLVDEIYQDTSKYGEKFIYRVPYNTAIGKLLATKPDSQIVAPFRGMNESDVENMNEVFALDISKNRCTIKSTSSSEFFLNEKAEVITESTRIRKGEEVTEAVISPVLADSETFNINIEICKSNIIESAVLSAYDAFKKRNEYTQESLCNLREQEIVNEAKDKEIEAKGNIRVGKAKLDPRVVVANDGLFTNNGKSTDDIVKVKAPGCVVKKLAREQVIPIYIDDICMGYYYFELKTTDNSESFMGFKNILGDPLTNMRGNSGSVFNAVDNKRQDETIKYVAGRLSNFIDKQFVNANQDLAKEIYMILKFNDLFNTPSIDLIKVTFIPPEDMVHFYFRLDPITHRGISDLDKSLIPAKIYSSLYITYAIGSLTRSQDKRVYYVKQTVDTNIAQTLLNTISQIKQSNFGIRQFQNINNVLNITGRFNDYVIPQNASGDPPIDFQVLPGQDINAPTELMDQLEEMAINSTGIPIEFIQSRQSVDYAMQLTMSSSKVQRFCYNRQELFQDLLTELITPIYNYEYDENSTIEVTLPPPNTININNTNAMADNARQFAQSIVDMELGDSNDDKLKMIYTRELFKHYLGTHLDISSHESILKRSRMLAEKDSPESHSDGSDSDY